MKESSGVYLGSDMFLMESDCMMTCLSYQARCKAILVEYWIGDGFMCTFQAATPLDRPDLVHGIALLNYHERLDNDVCDGTENRI